MSRSFLALLSLALGAALASACTSPCAMDASPLRLRVLTYNIHHGEGMDRRFDLPRLAKIITDLNPDLVAVQEVDFRTQRASGVDQCAELGRLTGLHAAFGRALYYSGGEYGEAVLSRFPIERVRTHPLPFRPGHESRAALAVRVSPGGGLPDIEFVGTHLCHQSEEVRVDQARQLHDLFAGMEGVAAIVAGDLNARQGSAPMNALLEHGWSNASGPETRIDYVLVRESDPWHVVEVRIVDEKVASDHPPVLVELEWRGGDS